jgi:hypothetical protein
MWKPLKSASMSRQRRRMALSASNDVARTLKRFLAAFSSAQFMFISSLCRHTTLFTPEAQEVPKHAGGEKPPACFLSFKTPQSHRCAWNEQRGPLTPPHCVDLTTKRKNAAGVAKERFGTSWRRPRQIGRNYAPDFDGAHPQGVQ